MSKESHYCLGGESHTDGCECQCDTCKSRRSDLEREDFNRRLSDAIQKQNRQRFE